MLQAATNTNITMNIRQTKLNMHAYISKMKERQRKSKNNNNNKKKHNNIVGLTWPQTISLRQYLVIAYFIYTICVHRYSSQRHRHSYNVTVVVVSSAITKKVQKKKVQKAHKNIPLSSYVFVHTHQHIHTHIYIYLRNCLFMFDNVTSWCRQSLLFVRKLVKQTSTCTHTRTHGHTSMCEYI